MRYSEKSNFAIVKSNSYTGEVDPVMHVVRGRDDAGIKCFKLESDLSKLERDAGWSYYVKPTSLPVTSRRKRRRALKPGAGKKRL